MHANIISHFGTFLIARVLLRGCQRLYARGAGAGGREGAHGGAESGVSAAGGVGVLRDARVEQLNCVGNKDSVIDTCLW